MNRSSPNFLPLIAAIFGSCLWGTVPYLSISLYKSGLNAESILLMRFWLSLVVIGPIALATSGRLSAIPLRPAITVYLAAAVIGTAYVLLYFQSLRRVPSSIAILLFFTYPAITLVTERVLFKIAIPRIKALAAVLIVAGSGLAAGKFGDFKGPAGMGLLFAALAPLGYCVYLQITSRALKSLPAWSGAFMIYSGLGTGFLGVTLFTDFRPPVDTASWLQLGGIVVFGSAIPTAAFAFSMPRLGPSAYGIVASSELLTVIAMGVILLGEHLSVLQICGATLVIFGIVLSQLTVKTLESLRFQSRVQGAGDAGS